MNRKKIQPFLDKMEIVSKYECEKLDMKRWHYIIKIDNEVFDYYGSAKDFEDEIWKAKADIDTNPKSLLKKKYWKVKLIADDEIKTDALYCLISDYNYWDYNLIDFLEEMGYCDDYKMLKEWWKIYNQILINKQKLDDVFTSKEIEILQKEYQDF